MNGGRRTGSTRRGAVLVATIAALLIGTVVAVPAEAASGVTKKTFSNATPVSVPDGAPAVEASWGVGDSWIEVTGLTGSITRVTASVHVTHGRTSDLYGLIVPPANGPVELYADLFEPLPSSGTSLGTSCADGDRMVFDDTADTSVEQGTSPFVGTYRPQDDLARPLSVFNDNAGGSNGAWMFYVLDSVPGETGTIECWSLFIETDANEQVRFDSTGPVDITDATEGSGGPGVGSSTITTSGLMDAVSQVTVSVWVSHPNDRDLELALVSPSGTEVTLAAGLGGAGDNFGSSCSKATTFDDSAKTYITSASAPFVGSFRPQSPLGRLANDAANGAWTLRVTDTTEENVGTIMCWKLTITSTAPSATPPAPGLTVTPLLTAPAPLPGSYDYAYFAIRNDGTTPVSNVTLTSTLSNSWADVRAEGVAFPDCEVVSSQITCTYAEIGPGASVIGGAVARVNEKKGKVCLDGTVTATGISPVQASGCFALSSYPKGDRGTGYAVGDRAHDIRLQDQDGNFVSLSDFAGKYVLLQFTSVWCGPSQFEVPQDRDETAALNASNAMGTDVVYLTVMLDGPYVGIASTQQNAIYWASRFDLDTPVLFTENDTTKSAVQQHMTYDIVAGQDEPAVPTSIFIRPNGTIFDVRIGIEEPGGTTARFLADLN